MKSRGTRGHGHKTTVPMSEAADLVLPERERYRKFRRQERAKGDKRLAETKGWDMREKLIEQMRTHTDG